MAIPRLVIRTDRLVHNATKMLDFCRSRSVELTAVTKGVAGSPRIAEAFLRAGIVSLGDSRIANLRRLRNHRLAAELYLIRSPIPSEIEQVVSLVDGSVNTELEVIRSLNEEAQRQGKVHNVLVMVELGDLREGVLMDDVAALIEEIQSLTSIRLQGLGANLACLSGIAPSERRMVEFSRFAEGIQMRFGVSLDRVSGGNSSNYQWMRATANLGMVNHVRVGESILLGSDSVTHAPLEGFATDAFALVTEVIEVKDKPCQGKMMRRGLLALGWQDVDVAALCVQSGLRVLGATSDHLVVDASESTLRVGDEVWFEVGYSALMGSMASPYVEKVFVPQGVA